MMKKDKQVADQVHHLTRVVLEVAELKITIQRMTGVWFFQVLKGGSIHVESKEFVTYRQAIVYAFERYGIVTENRGAR